MTNEEIYKTIESIAEKCKENKKNGMTCFDCPLAHVEREDEHVATAECVWLTLMEKLRDLPRKINLKEVREIINL